MDKGAELERLQEQNDALQRMSLQARILQAQAVAVKAESAVWRLSTKPRHKALIGVELKGNPPKVSLTTAIGLGLFKLGLSSAMSCL